MSTDDTLMIVDHDPTPSTTKPAWKILVVDDDPTVLAATRYALANIEVLGAPLEIVEASSALSAKEILTHDSGFAVAFVDVVMETPDAGLKLVQAIRDELDLRALRIVIRTGQPGQAPEISVIEQYDINDYRHKADLDRTRLITSLTAAIRAYKQIESIKAHRRGLEKVIDDTSDLMSKKSLGSFADGVLTQICSIGGSKNDGAVILKLSSDSNGRDGVGEPKVLAAAGIFADFSGKTLAELPAEKASTFFDGLNLAAGTIKVDGRQVTLRTRSPRGDDLVIFFETDIQPDAGGVALLRVFAAKIAVGLDNVRLHDELYDLANLDTVTKLPNHIGWAKICADAPNVPMVILRLDDHPLILGIFGQGPSQNYILAIVNRLKEFFPIPNQIGRLQADVLCVMVLPGQKIADIVTALATPIFTNGISYLVRYRMGSSNEIASGATNFFNAVAASTLAKSDSTPIVFSPDLVKSAETRFRMLHEISDPQNADRVTLFLQPQIQLSTGKIISCEALMRWRRDDGSLVQPSEFIQLSETSGLIVKHGRKIARLAIDALAGLRREGHDLTMSINCSPRELNWSGFADRLAAKIDHYGVTPNYVTVEITESAFAGDSAISKREIDALIAHGFRLSIDDFGTGHSSLMRLVSLPVSEVKLDRSLCSKILVDQRAKAMAKLVLELGNDLGFHVLAEGIETPDQQNLLQDLGCPIGQGYLFGRPMPVDRFVDTLQNSLA
jgi:EAL domain-containing protein (putative c-di-GMP-specific phosphodiesterase class I)/CheY-like chemotaxis protein